MTTYRGRAESPAEEYLRLVWDARWLYATTLAVFVGGALLLTLVLPKRYESVTLVSVRTPPALEPTAMLYDGVLATGPQASGSPATAQQYVRRLQANQAVTLAARDAGIISADRVLEERDISRWVAVEHVEGTDLIEVAVRQPTREAARAFAERLVVRVVDAGREEAAASVAKARELLDAALGQAREAVATAEAAVRAAAAEGVSEEDIPLENARLELTLARDAYAAIRKRLAALDLIVAERQPVLQVVDPPTTPVNPVFPRPLLFVGIALILALLVATLITILRSMVSAGVHEPPVEQAVGTRMPARR